MQITFLYTGGRIDQAHHLSQAKRSLYDTVAFADAVEASVEATSESDTLIITTADHSHTFTIGGYPSRGNPILGRSCHVINFCFFRHPL